MSNIQMSAIIAHNRTIDPALAHHLTFPIALVIDRAIVRERER